MSAEWGNPADWDTVCRRSAGRRRYNAARKALRNQRRAQIIVRLPPRPWPWGLGVALARALGVSPATISRDLGAIRNADRGALLK
jgi:hypothetical protein